MRPTTTSQAPAPAASQGPSRFQVVATPQEAPTTVRRIGYLLALLALVVGVPMLLLWLFGPPPVPTSIPGREDLTRSIGMEQVMTVLVAVVWLAWLQFVTCLMVELFSTVRHQGVPSPVPFSGPSQRLARILVGGLMLAGVVGGQVASVMNAVSLDNARSATTISTTVRAGDAATSNVLPTMGQGAYVVAVPNLDPRPPRSQTPCRWWGRRSTPSRPRWVTNTRVCGRSRRGIWVTAVGTRRSSLSTRRLLRQTARCSTLPG